MKAARTRSQGVLGVGRPRIFMLLALLVVGSVLSIVSSLSTSTPASALTQAQKDFCISNFGTAGTVVRSATGSYAAGWVDNKCGDEKVCSTEAGASYRGNPPQLKSTGCDANASVSDGPVGKTSDAATLGILVDKYGNSAVTGYCGSDAKCIAEWQSKIRDRVKVCIEAYDYDANKTVFPDISPGALANCVATGIGKSGSEAAIKKQLAKDHDAITAEAQNSSDANTQQACEDGGGTWSAETSSCEEPKGSDCAIEGIGWLICPAITFMAQLNDKAYAFLASNFLSVNLDLNDASSPVKDAWAKFRDIANVLFVIAFLVVVYSQLTSVGINNYGIKKMLPKIVIAAVLVNMSFIICQLSVDLSNILGYGISSFFNSLTIGPVTDSTSKSLLGSGNLAWVPVFGGVLAGAIGVALAVGVPVILSALLAIGLIVLILIGRQALIVLLITIAPVAFVAYLLPNTEQWFKKWVKMFSTLLLLFPIIALVFGASGLAAKIVNNAASGDPLMQVVALGITALPFFVVPSLLKGALSAAGAVGSKLSGMADKATGKVSSRARATADERFKRTGIARGFASGKTARAAARNAKYARKVNSGEGFTARTARAGAFIGGGGAGTTALKRSALTAASEEASKEVQAAKLEMQKQANFIDHRTGQSTKLDNENGLDMAKSEFMRAMASGDEVKARAAQDILTHSGNAGLSKLQGAYEDLGAGASVKDAGGKELKYDYGSTMQGDAGQKALSDLNEAGLKGKNVALDQFSRTKMDGSAASTMGSVQQSASTYGGLNANEFTAQSAANLEHAATSGALDSVMAKTIQGTEGYAALDAKKRATIDRVAGGAPAPASSTPPPAGSGSSSVPPRPGSTGGTSGPPPSPPPASPPPGGTGGTP